MKIGNVEIPSKLVLAPMAGVSDIAFRTVCREKGAGFTFTEMVSAKALSFNDIKTKSLLEIADNEHPVAVQIFGHEPDIMAESALKAIEISHADILDINMGCPVGKVVSNGDGSALMQNPDLAQKIIEAVVNVSPVPVTVKFRKGWDKGSVIAVEFAQMIQDSGASAITLHGRTRAQMFSGNADWNIIRDVKEKLQIPVIANGDIFSGSDAAEMLKITVADALMIGRGAFGNPWIFEECKKVLNGEDYIPPTVCEKMDTAVHQFELAVKYKGETIGCLEARKHFAWYLKGLPHSAYYRAKATGVSTLKDIYSLADDIRKEYAYYIRHKDNE